VPIGLFFGRLANFINGELYGRPSHVPWAMIFPKGGDVPRHPSQFYEAGLEGIVLGGVLFFLARQPAIRRTEGILIGTLLIGYGLSRFFVEFVREPDRDLGLYFGYFSMGQLLSLPMIIAGIIIISYARKRRAAAAAKG
jgi:phosphatidylglycerol:prolipoprotein diacylglycerol transferase